MRIFLCPRPLLSSRLPSVVASRRAARVGGHGFGPILRDARHSVVGVAGSIPAAPTSYWREVGVVPYSITCLALGSDRFRSLDPARRRLTARFMPSGIAQ